MAKITINKDRCKGCGVCTDFCPQKLIVIVEEEMNALGYRPAGFADEQEACKGCKVCAEMCPDMCIEVYR